MGIELHRPEVAVLVATAIWLQADFARAGRDRAQCGGGVSGDQEQAVAFWRLDDGELRFADEQRPWERAGAIVASTLTGPLGAGEWAVASPAASLPAGKSVAPCLRLPPVLPIRLTQI
jgi:hypothetical protein